jgi:hypothetical protein
VVGTDASGHGPGDWPPHLSVPGSWAPAQACRNGAAGDDARQRGQTRYRHLGYAIPPTRSPAVLAYGRHMALFLVFRDLPGITRDQYTAAQRAAADASRQYSQAGREVSYLGGFFLTATGRAICIFQAESAADVAAVNNQAGVPATDIVEAIDLRAAT